MVVLASRFALAAAIVTLSALESLPRVDAAAVLRRSNSPSATSAGGQGPTRHVDHKTLPLPALMKNKSSKSSHTAVHHSGKSKKKSKHHKEKHSNERSLSSSSRDGVYLSGSVQAPFSLSKSRFRRRDDEHVHEHIHEHIHDDSDYHHHHHHHHDHHDYDHDVDNDGHGHYHEHKHVHGRSSLLIPNGSQTPYVVVRSDDGIPGTIQVRNKSGHVFASLSLNTTSNPYSFDAKDKDATLVYLVSASGNATSGKDSEEQIVYLQVDLDDMDKKQLVRYCSQWSNRPGPLLLSPCQTQPDDSSASQLFAYDPQTSVVRPYASDSASNSTNERRAGSEHIDVQLIFVASGSPIQSAESQSVEDLENAEDSTTGSAPQPQSSAAPSSSLASSIESSSSTAPTATPSIYSKNEGLGAMNVEVVPSSASFSDSPATATPTSSTPLDAIAAASSVIAQMASSSSSAAPTDDSMPKRMVVRSSRFVL